MEDVHAVRPTEVLLTRSASHLKIYGNQANEQIGSGLTAAAVANCVALRFGFADQEVMGVLFLDVRRHLIADRELFRGTIQRIHVEPRQVFRAELHYRASSVVLFHTHTGGDPTPWADDLAFTQRIEEVEPQMGIRLVDHLIVVGLGRWLSKPRRGQI